jgi:predicted amidohydrolase YtcJ
MKRPILAALGSLVVAAACNQSPTVEPATLVLKGGKIVTVDTARPEAQAIAIRGDKIAALGTNDEIQAYVVPATQVIDLAGQTAVPGLIEGHGHFTGVGRARMSLKLMGVKDFETIVAMVGDAAKTARAGDWIQGRGWHQEKWDHVPTPNVEGFPLHASLSAISPNNPVVLTHASGHAMFANAKAMELAGVTRATPNPPGGEILKDQAGNPIGVFRETAQGLIGAALDKWQKSKTPEEIMADRRKEIDLAIDESLTKGITSFQDAGASFETIDLYKQYVTDGKMGVRLWVMVRQPNGLLRQKLAAYKVVGMGDNRLTVAAIKVTADGALGSRGAWMLEPYSDSPASTGLSTTPIESITETAKIAMENGVQLCIHCIGDRANREVLNVFEAAFKANPDKKDNRWRIEHAQHLNAADIPRFGQLGVIASMQGIHATSDAPYVVARLGAKRAEEGAYVWQKLMKSGAIVSNGTDTPVEAIDPIPNFYALVTRKTTDGTVFYGDQKMTRAEALKAYTYNPAFAAKEEGLKGSLAAGKLADITVLSKDIMTVPDDEILSAQVTYTIVGGKVAFKR